MQLDKVWSFMLKKQRNSGYGHRCAAPLRARQIVAYVIGIRSESICLKLWQTMPDTYTVRLLAISGTLMQKLFQKKRIRALAKKVDRPIIRNVRRTL
jgi:hypothetical protein